MDSDVAQQLTRLAQAIARLERKTDFMLRELKLTYVDEPESDIPDQLSRVYELVRLGKKIDAIKEYRLQTGVGLAEAKSAVDSIELGQKDQ